MRRTTTVAIVAALAVIALAGTALAGGNRTADRSKSDVYWFGDATTPVGESQLVRTDGEAIATFRSSGLAPSETVTLWWVVFNDPSGCSDACGEDDIFLDGDPAKGLNEAGIESADIVVGYADGAVADDDGTVALAGSVRVDGPVREVLFGAAPLLKDASAAEIHLVARSHGPPQAGAVFEQIGSYAGGCEVFLHPPEIPDAIGECADIQFSVHLP